jgi:peptidoglycan pentaglycine glycine transferase (the first glycine)
MFVKIVNNVSDWENFLKTQEFTPFVQSSKYIDFYTSLQEKGFILGIFEGEKLIGGSVVVTTHAKRGNFLYLPYGPILPQKQREQSLKVLVEYLKKYGKENAFDFVRVSPFLDDTLENKQLFLKNNFQPAPMHVLAENTWMLDITDDEETLLKNMNKNHRNLIRRCEREGVVIKKSTDINSLKNLSELLDTTAKRHNFIRFSDHYIESEFQAFLPSNVMLFEAFLPDGSLDGAAVILFYGNMAAYRHSASLNINSKLPSSYLLQWHVIQEAKKRGIQWYNFWGIAPETASKEHPFFGITHFKKGFGGQKKDLLHCQDLPLSKKYWFNWIIESIRRIKRGF